jgi:hypothetical protein
MATPRNELENQVGKYLFTFQQEAGQNSLYPHVPSNDDNTKSGVTIGAGYDLGKFEHSEHGRLQAFQELSALGIDEHTAKSLSDAAGLKGNDAHVWVDSHKSIQITEDNQVNLFNNVIPQYEQKAQDILNHLANDPKHDIYSEDVKWENLSPEQKEVFFEYAYHGVLGKFPSFVEAVSKEDWSRATVEHERYADGKPLTNRNNEFFNEYLFHNLQNEQQAEKAHEVFEIEPLNTDLGPFSVLEDTTHFDGKTLSNELKEEISHDIKDRYIIDNFNQTIENDSHEKASFNDFQEHENIVLADNGNSFNENQTVVVEPVNSELFEPISLSDDSTNPVFEDFNHHTFDNNTGVIIEHEPFIPVEEPIDFVDSKFSVSDIVHDFLNNSPQSDPGLIIEHEPIITGYEPDGGFNPIDKGSGLDNLVFNPISEQPILPENTMWNTPLQPIEPSVFTLPSFESSPQPDLFANNSVDVFSTQNHVEPQEVTAPSIAVNDLWANNTASDISNSSSWNTPENDPWKAETPPPSITDNSWNTPTSDPWAVETPAPSIPDHTWDTPTSDPWAVETPAPSIPDHTWDTPTSTAWTVETPSVSPPDHTSDNSMQTASSSDSGMTSSSDNG